MNVYSPPLLLLVIMRMNTIRLLLILTSALPLAGCPSKEEYPVRVPTGFLLEATLTPSARTVRRGDTLWLDVNCSDSLLDYHSGRRYRVCPQDLGLRSFLVYEELLGVGQLPAGIARTFRLVERVGQAAINGSTTGSLTLVHDGARYRARIGLIPTKAGVTSIKLGVSPPNVPGDAIGQPLPFISLPLDAQGRRQEATLDDSFYAVNDGKANNFDLYAQYKRAFALEPGAPLKTLIYEQKSTFTVEVN